MHWDYSKGNPPSGPGGPGPASVPPDPEKIYPCNKIVLKTGEVCDQWFRTKGELKGHEGTLIHVKEYDQYVSLRHHLEFKAESHVTLSICEKCGKTFKKVRPFLFPLELILLISSFSQVICKTTLTSILFSDIECQVI
jgi:hypothetical protein